MQIRHCKFNCFGRTRFHCNCHQKTLKWKNFKPDGIARFFYSRLSDVFLSVVELRSRRVPLKNLWGLFWRPGNKVSNGHTVYILCYVSGTKFHSLYYKLPMFFFSRCQFVIFFFLFITLVFWMGKHHTMVIINIFTSLHISVSVNYKPRTSLRRESSALWAPCCGGFFHLECIQR